MSIGLGMNRNSSQVENGSADGDVTEFGKAGAVRQTPGTARGRAKAKPPDPDQCPCSTNCS